MRNDSAAICGLKREQVEALDRCAHAIGLSRASLVRALILAYVEQNDPQRTFVDQLRNEMEVLNVAPA